MFRCYLYVSGADWEDCGYDDKHRHFFRLLRQRYINVFTVYESMQFSVEFLSRLRQRHILTDPEYNQLLVTAQTQPERAILNKELMDVVNQKMPQLQEMFADQLCRYQTHLVMVDDASSSSGEFSYQITIFHGRWFRARQC